MKLHLPKQLFTALLAAITLATPATLSLGSAAWGAEITITESNQTLNAEENVAGNTYVIDYSSNDNAHLWNGNKEILADVRIVEATLNNGYSPMTYTFSGAVSGSGEFSFDKGTASGQHYIFKGDMSAYSGKMAIISSSSSEASDFTFDSNKTGTGAIEVSGNHNFVRFKGATVLNSTVTTTNLQIGTGTSKSETVIGRLAGQAEDGSAISAISTSITASNSVAVVSGATLNLVNGSLTSSGAFTNSGSVIVGSGASMVLNGGYTEEEGASFTVNGSLTLGGTVVLRDAITANGAVTLGSGVVFDLAHLTVGEDNRYTLFTGAESVTFTDVSFTNGRAGWSYTMQSNGTALATFLGKTVTWHGDGNDSANFEWGANTTFSEGGAFATYDNVNITGADAIKLTSAVTASTVTIGAGDGSDITVSFTNDSNILTVTEGLIIQDGATVEINKKTDSVGFIQGEVTIENGGVLKFNAKDVTGYNGGATSMHTINVQAGGELQLNITGNETFAGTLNLDGTLKGLVSGTASTWDLFSNNNNKATIVVSDGASATMDNVNIRLRQNNSVITVGENATLNLSGTITQGSGGNGVLYKEGAGAMTVGGTVTLPSIYLKAGSLTFNDTVTLTGGMNIGDASGHPTTQLVFAGSGKEHTINGTLKVDGKNSSISIAEGSSLTVGTLNVSWLMSGLTVNGLLEATTEMIIGSGSGEGNAWRDKFTGTGQVVTKKLTTNNWATTSIGVNSLTIGDGGLSVNERSTLTLKSLTTTIEGTTNVSGGTHLELASGTVTMNGNLSSTGTLTIESEAKLELNGASNTVSGTFTVNNGAAITLAENAVLDLTGKNVGDVFGMATQSVSGAGTVKYAGAALDATEAAYRVSWRKTDALNFATDVEVANGIALNTYGDGTNKIILSSKNLTVGGELRLESGARLSVSAGAVSAGTISLGHSSAGNYGHIELTGGSITTGEITKANSDDTGNTLTMSGGVLEITSASGIDSGIQTTISGGTLKATNASWTMSVVSLGNAAFDIAAGQSITLSGAMSLTGTLTHSGAGELVFNNSSLSMSQEALNSLRITSTELATGTNGFSTLQYHLVNTTGSGTTSGTATSVQVGDASLAFNATTGIISSAEQTFVINGTYSTAEQDAVTNLTNASLGIVVGETGQFTISGAVSDDLTVNTILSSTAGTGTLVLDVDDVTLNNDLTLSNFHGKLQVKEGRTLTVDEKSKLMDLTNLQEIELQDGATMDVGYGTGVKADTIKLNSDSVLQLQNGGGAYNTLEADLLIAGDATLKTSTFGNATEVHGSISGNAVLSIEKISDNDWILGSTISDGTGEGDALALHFTHAPLTDEEGVVRYVYITGDNSYSGGTTVDEGHIKTGHVNALGTGNVTLKESAALVLESDLSIQGALDSAGAVTMGDNTTLALGGGTAETRKQHSIGTLSGAAAGVTLGDYASLTLGGGTAEAQKQHSIGTLSAAAAGVTLGDYATLTLGGGTAEAQKQHSIGTLSAAAAGVTLGDHATLTLGGGTAEAQAQHSIGTLSGSSTATLSLSANSSLALGAGEVGMNLTGSGELTKTGDGTLALTKANDGFIGNIIVSGGVLKAGANPSDEYFGDDYKGNKARTITVQNGAKLDVNGTEAYYHVVLEQGATITNSGTNTNNNNNGNVGSGWKALPWVELKGDAEFNAEGQMVMQKADRDSGTFKLNLNGHTLTKTGGNKLYMKNVDITSGCIQIEAGEVQLDSGVTLDSGVQIGMADDTTLTLSVNASLELLSAASGTVNIAENTTLTLGDGSTTTTHTIGTLSSHSTSKVSISSGSNLILTSVASANGDITGDGALTLQTRSTVGLGHNIFGSAINTINLTGAGSGLEITNSTTQPANFGKIQNINVEDGATFYNGVTSDNGWVLNPENNINISLAGAGNGAATDGAALSLGYNCTNGGTVAFGDKVNFSLSDAATVIVHGRNTGNNADIAGVINTTIQGNGHTLTKIGTGKLTLENGASNTSLNVNEGELVLKGAATTSERVELNGGTLKLADQATVTTRQGSADAATMSKVQMSSTGITGTAQDGSSRIANADIEIAQLAQDASFTIQDMTLTNTTITAASVNIKDSKVSGNVVLNVVKPTEAEAINTSNVGQGGTEGEINFLYGLALEDNNSSLTLNMEVPQAILPSESGLYTLTITLNGFAEDFDFSKIDSQVVFGADSWLGQALTGASTSVMVDGETISAGAAAAQSSGAPSVSYDATSASDGNVGSLVITINGLNVPEPTTSTLSLLALAGLAARRRRK